MTMTGEEGIVPTGIKAMSRLKNSPWAKTHKDSLHLFVPHIRKNKGCSYFFRAVSLTFFIPQFISFCGQSLGRKFRVTVR